MEGFAVDRSPAHTSTCDATTIALPEQHSLIRRSGGPRRRRRHDYWARGRGIDRCMHMVLPRAPPRRPSHGTTSVVRREDEGRSIIWKTHTGRGRQGRESPHYCSTSCKQQMHTLFTCSGANDWWIQQVAELSTCGIYMPASARTMHGSVRPATTHGHMHAASSRPQASSSLSCSCDRWESSHACSKRRIARTLLKFISRLLN
jgi:hypothetical protein